MNMQKVGMLSQLLKHLKNSGNSMNTGLLSIHYA